MSRELDDQGMKARPTCRECKNAVASWLVTMAGGAVGLGAARKPMCTSCAQGHPSGRRRALRSSDY